jgi:hypothetical protein
MVLSTTCAAESVIDPPVVTFVVPDVVPAPVVVDTLSRLVAGVLGSHAVRPTRSGATATTQRTAKGMRIMNGLQIRVAGILPATVRSGTPEQLK